MTSDHQSNDQPIVSKTCLGWAVHGRCYTNQHSRRQGKIFVGNIVNQNKDEEKENHISQWKRLGYHVRKGQILLKHVR